MTPLSSILRDKHSRVLVVDDLPDNSFLIQAILIDEGYEIQVADNGRAALESIQSHPPDLLILDVMMPQMDGYEVTKMIRQNPDLPIFPILLITAHDTPSAVKGLDVGADDFIRKPVEVAELLARVRSLLRLKHTMDERDRIASQREDFVSRLTHDLRTPLVASDRMLDLILQGHFGEFSGQLKEVLATMASSNENLLELVNNLLQVYRFESGLYPLNFIQVDLAVVVHDVVKQLQPLCDGKGLILNVETDRESLVVEGDRLELRRVLTNLLGNAIKFTKAGRVDISVSSGQASSEEESAFSSTVIRVQDTGIGIAVEQQKQLFERFQSGSHQSSGSGLGLHVTKYIVEAHHGTIKVESELEQGSTFTVTMPVKQPS
ncbi:MAG: hybrid sensor histidine kinase/response regulator [Cyanobacteria bacterium P01_F01_bin.42]